MKKTITRVLIFVVFLLMLLSGGAAIASDDLFALEQYSCRYGPIKVIFNKNRVEVKLLREGIEVQSKAPFQQIQVCNPKRHLMAKITLDRWIAEGPSTLYFLPVPSDLPKSSPWQIVTFDGRQCSSVTWAPGHVGKGKPRTGMGSRRHTGGNWIRSQAIFLNGYSLPNGLHDFFLGLYRIGSEGHGLPIRYGVDFQQGERLELYTSSLRILKSNVAKFDDCSGYRLARLPDVVSDKDRQEMMERIMAGLGIETKDAPARH